MSTEPALREMTVKEFAGQEGVTERTVRRWIESGAVDVRRTPGGGIRIRDRRQHARQTQSSADNR